MLHLRTLVGLRLVYLLHVRRTFVQHGVRIGFVGVVQLARLSLLKQVQQLLVLHLRTHGQRRNTLIACDFVRHEHARSFWLEPWRYTQLRLFYALLWVVCLRMRL